MRTRYDTLLRARQLEEDAARAALAEADSLLTGAESELMEASDLVERRSRGLIAATTGSGVAARQLEGLATLLRAARKEEAVAGSRAAEAGAAREAKRKALEACVRERRAAENLVEAERERLEAEARRRETKLMDEAGARRTRSLT